MYGSAGASKIVPGILGLMGLAFVPYTLVKDFHILGGSVAGTHANPNWATQTAQNLKSLPREGSARNVFMNPISNEYIPKEARTSSSE